VSKPQVSRLLALPAELQLIIYKYAVASEEPLHVNCPCDSSYGGWSEEYYDDQQLWNNNEKQPPWQPSLCRVQSSIRADALPMFYENNVFQAGYCHECDLDKAVAWLRVIGRENRRLLKNFRFLDENGNHDRNCPDDLKALKRSAIFKDMGGRMDSSYCDFECVHSVSFPGDGDELEGIAHLYCE
jgi:hypothetical protein